MDLYANLSTAFGARMMHRGGCERLRWPLKNTNTPVKLCSVKVRPTPIKSMQERTRPLYLCRWKCRSRNVGGNNFIELFEEESRRERIFNAYILDKSKDANMSSELVEKPQMTPAGKFPRIPFVCCHCVPRKDR
jgi:hypothetical protein